MAFQPVVLQTTTSIDDEAFTYPRENRTYQQQELQLQEKNKRHASWAQFPIQNRSPYPAAGRARVVLLKSRTEIEN